MEILIFTINMPSIIYKVNVKGVNSKLEQVSLLPITRVNIHYATFGDILIKFILKK